ncbi:SGNH/GDSL hydrolase family protein [Nocardia sp. NPDC050435]|uniref:SGNH/GDSL hydrolase family protein n=1 Tax=Nocardia sp. NPDC050435 TaxID=3155040 RepID=UPI0034045881
MATASFSRMSGLRRLSVVVFATAAVFVASAVATAAPPHGHEPSPHGAQFVALGDSGAATTGKISLDLHAPIRCMQSTVNSPKLVAAQLGLVLDDRSCSGAKIAHLATSQAAGIAPQFDALGPATKVVTLHIGANDVPTTRNHVECHLDSLAAGDCATAAAAWPQRTEAIAGAYGAALDEIARRAPEAQIFVDGWPTYVREQSCPAVLLTPGAATTVQRGYDLLNSLVAREATKRGAIYIDTRGPGIGHDACAPDTERWIEPLLAGDTLMPFHLTPLGMRGVADLIAFSVRTHLTTR